jgi:hypothetical protein
MLRSLNPETQFTTPKSKAMRPTKAEEKLFSEEELESVERQLEANEAWKLRRAVAQKQLDAVRQELGVSGSRGSARSESRGA